MSARSWSGEQDAIFDWGANGDGNLEVVARAGCGKTTTITEMVQRMPESRILLAAFNKSIATELQQRIGSQRSEHAVPWLNVEARTLNSLGLRFVRKHANVQIDENGERPRTLALSSLPPGAPKHVVNLVSKLHTKGREIDPWLALGDETAPLVELASTFDLLPSEELEVLGWTAEKVAEAALCAMKSAMKRTALIDFADMIFLPLVHGWVTPSYDAVVVDEAQDMSVAQLALSIGACAGRMCVVGDDRQAIYGFRGADSGSLARLQVELNAKVLGLKTTYRCGKSIVAEAAQLVPDFIAHESNGDGVVEALSYGKALESVDVGDFVLSRKNAPLVRACMTLLKRGVRASIKGRDIAGGVQTLVRKLLRTGEQNARGLDELPGELTRWTTREIDRAQKRLGEQACEERVAFVLDQSAIVTAIADESDDVRDFERRCDALFSDDGTRASVMLSSVHRAKGLEADNVFLLRDTFKAGTQEEDNIRYVAITRAKRRLVWVDGVAA